MRKQLVREDLIVSEEHKLDPGRYRNVIVTDGGVLRIEESGRVTIDHLILRAGSSGFLPAAQVGSVEFPPGTRFSQR